MIKTAYEAGVVAALVECGLVDREKVAFNSQDLGNWLTPMAGALGPMPAGMMSAATAPAGSRLSAGGGAAGGSMVGGLGGGLAGGAAGAAGGAGLSALLAYLNNKQQGMFGEKMDIGNAALTGGIGGGLAGMSLGGLGGSMYGAHLGRQEGLK